ncbi:LAS1-like (Saccharomyces cerevisiae) [Seminavis robusta]|uniref:LAS1-like (Saccharomyces cerevisiae) n=1 Tax=Seminavis robusta TaxID=568900 RepID=A0A9N8DH74_9STRA|nr:LAS1-like (Saccharomyces cerevisiae) [Seminavis robusta]|eukprot:Sro65_g036750.1 LAS1-like (Saccharomyces cerevisiae) (699) ;mRNA; f:63473-65569
MSSTSSSPEKKHGSKKHARLDPSTPWLISDSLSEHHVSRNKRLKAMVKETPWADQWEFESVGRSLIHAARILPQRRDDNNLSSLQQALRRVSVWKLRGTNRLPHAVESSYQLAQCLWNDYYYCSKERRGAEELRLAYGCSILRSINGLADKMQQTRYHAGSVAMLCAELGVPSWLVDIRHDSTHNQIPTLSVLRLSAITLLEYYHQEFWVPRMSHDETAHLMELLQDYQQSQQQQQVTLLIEEAPPSTTPTASSPPNKNTVASSAKTSRKSPDDSSSTDSDDDDESEEEVYVDGLNPSSTSSFWRPPAAQLGTNVNRFAALVKNDKDKANKKKPTKPPKTIAAPPAKKKIKTTGPSAHHMAMKFVKAARSHWELAQHTALLFLVWGDKGAAAALIPTDNSNVSSPQTEEGIQTMRKQYTPLLSVLGKQWPGFLPALMTHLVDHILLLNQESSSTNSTGGTDDSSAPAMMESSRQSTSTERKLFFLESWVRYLVSREFVSKVHAVPKSSRSTKAPWAVLQKMWCPLNSLCDRLVVASSAEGSALPTIQRLAEYLELVLGSNRVANFGVEYPQEGKEPQKDCDVKVGGETSQTSVEALKDTVETQKESAVKPPVSKEAKKNANLSLDELEAMLFNADSNKGEEGSHPVSNAASGLPTESSKVDAESQKKVTLPQTKQRTAWVRCAVWEPCAIGTLPGHLN